MDYSPWSERENWLNSKVAISPKPEKLHPPKLMCMHVTFFTTMDYSSWPKGKFDKNKKEQNLRNEKVSALKIGLHACHFNLYLYELCTGV